MEAQRYLMIEPPNTAAVVDFLGRFPVSVKLQIDEKGELWIRAISATQDAPILIDQTFAVPPADPGDEDD